MPGTPRRLALGLLAVSLSTAACGLKPQAYDAIKTQSGGGSTLAQQPGTAVGGAGGTATGGAPSTGTGAAPLPGAPGSTGGSTSTGGGATTAVGGASTGGSTAAGRSGGGGAATAAGARTGSGGARPAGGSGTTTAAGGGSGSCGAPSGGDTTGVSANTISLGVHAPITGTGTPFPNNSFIDGAQVFWKTHKVCGRTVTVEVQDDKYNPTGAHEVCSQMAGRDFLVVGGGGTDQIQACATDSTIQGKGVPYLSAGVTTNGLTGLKNYFAVSLTYQQQGELVARNAEQLGVAKPAKANTGKQWAIITANTANFAGARKGIEDALNKRGVSYDEQNIDQSNSSSYQAEAQARGRQLALDGYKTIYVDTAPGYFVFLASGYYAAAGSGATWVGPGVTMSEVTVAQYLCSSTTNMISGHAYFLAPGPGVDKATEDFKSAYGGKYDDIQWSLWGLSSSLYQLLQNASDNLTRQNFITKTQTAKVNGAPYPPLNYPAGGGHFGGTGAWGQVINCGKTETDQSTAGAWDTSSAGPLQL